MRRTLGLVVAAWLAACSGQNEESSAPGPQPAPGPNDLAGRWNVTVESPSGPYPSWFEIQSHDGGLTGSFVGRVGSARPIETMSYQDGRLSFSLPPQYEEQKSNLSFTAEYVDHQLKGTTQAADGSLLRWTAVRAPELKADENVQWGEPIKLFNGQDLEGWRPRSPDSPNNWQAQDGLLVNTAKGSDLVTEQSFKDFKLQLEFNSSQGGNSGVYLRGRYEVQILDDHGRQPGSRQSGGVYGFITPSQVATLPAGEWQSYDITLLGRYVTVVVNGETVVEAQEIPGITGGALDSNEAEAGPIFLQGDHGPITFRNMVLTPVQ